MHHTLRVYPSVSCLIDLSAVRESELCAFDEKMRKYAGGGQATVRTASLSREACDGRTSTVRTVGTLHCNRVYTASEGT